MRVVLKFDASESNGLLSLKVNGQSVNVTEGPNILSVEVDPGDLTLEFSGKNPRRDTVVENGSIIRDKFINFSSININGFKLERYHLYHHFFDPFISNNCTRIMPLPPPSHMLAWYTQILEKHASL